MLDDEPVFVAEHANAAGLDVLRVLKMVIIHDLVEIDAGDTFAYDTARMADQHEREARAADGGAVHELATPAAARHDATQPSPGSQRCQASPTNRLS